jgi:hypothetical protein
MRSFNSLNQDFLHGLRLGVAVIVSMALLAGIGGLPAHNVQASPDIAICDFSGIAHTSYRVFDEIAGEDVDYLGGPLDPNSTVAAAAVQFV